MRAHRHVEHIPDEQRLLAGKRRSRRVRRQVDVRLTDRSGGRFTARTIDLSRGGMLVELTDPAFSEVGSGAGAERFVSLAARVSAHFSEGLTVRFGALQLRSRAQVVRLVTRVQDMAFLLGCRFTPALTDAECRLLGLDAHHDETRVEAVLSVPLRAVRGGRRPRARVSRRSSA